MTDKKKNSHKALTDEERAMKWKIIQGLAAQIVQDGGGNIKFSRKEKTRIMI